MFERYTERARQVVVLAQEEARRLKHSYIGPEHILLGLIAEEEGIGADALANLGITKYKVDKSIKKLVPKGKCTNQGQQIPFTPRAKKILELGLREALSHGHNYVGTEHLLLGVVREDQSVTTTILDECGVDEDMVRNEVGRLLTGKKAKPKKDKVSKTKSKKSDYDELIQIGKKVVTNIINSLDEVIKILEKKK